MDPADESAKKRQYLKEAIEPWQQLHVAALQTWNLIPANLSIHTVGEYKRCLRAVSMDPARIMDNLPIGTRFHFPYDTTVYAITRYILSKAGFIHQVYLEGADGIIIKKIWTSLLGATMIDRPAQNARLQDLIGVIRTKITPHVHAAYEHLKVEDLAEEIRVRSVRVLKYCLDLPCPVDATLEKMIAEEMETLER